MNMGGVLETDINAEHARLHMQIEAGKQGVTIDADAVLIVLARWVGWYRIEKESQSPKEQRSDAEEIVTLLERLRKRMSPDKINPEFRALLQENMRTLNVDAPDWARLERCAANAAAKLPTPKRGERTDTAPKYRAIRAVYEALRAHTNPQMDMEAADALAANLVRDAASVTVPTNRDELRKITRGN